MPRPKRILRIMVIAAVPSLSGCIGEPPGQPAGNLTFTSDRPAEPQSAGSDTVGPPQQEVPLISRNELFGNPEKARARISPDGSKLAYVAPVDGVLNVWVGPVDELDAARPVTHDTHRGIMRFYWSYTSNHLLYVQDKDGDEDFHVYSVDLAGDRITDLTPIDGISARIEAVSENFPEEILVGINDRDQRQLHDIYRVHIVTGERELVQENPHFAGFVTDDEYRIRFATAYTRDAGRLYQQPDEQGGWKDFLTIESVDAMTTGLAGFDKTGNKVYMLDSRQRNTGALKILDLESGAEQVLAENDKADISGVIVHPTEKHVQAVTYTYARREWQILDDSIATDLEYLRTVADGEIEITSRTLDDDVWTVAYIMDDGPLRFYLYDRAARQAKFLFTSRQSLEALRLVHMHPVIITSRDGLELVSYLTLPDGSDEDGDGKPTQPVPLVLLVHGGPWSRDGWGLDPRHQWLANRGYAVLSVNFRGSTGFGKSFVNSANRQWGAKMHDDLMDAVEWAVAGGIADRDRVAIMGGSYGGYAALVGLTFTPGTFACAVDVVGPSSLVTLLENPPPYWRPFAPVMKQRVGDHTTDEGRKFLNSRSPLHFVDRIERPLLIAQGANDPRVKQAEADQIVAAMNERKIPVTYLLYDEEGHGFARPENRLSYYAIAEAFLAEHLGGRFEPIGDAFDGAVFHVPSGADQVPGLREALLKVQGE